SSVGTQLFLGLRHNQRGGLSVRCRACELNCRQRCRGKQYETKSCHDDWDPGKKCNKLWRSTNKVRPDCGGLERRTCFLFRPQKVSMRPRSLRIQTIV